MRKRKYLSLGGRITLTKATLSNLGEVGWGWARFSDVWGNILRFHLRATLCSGIENQFSMREKKLPYQNKLTFPQNHRKMNCFQGFPRGKSHTSNAHEQ